MADELKLDSAQRVAFDLAMRIAQDSTDKGNRTEQYWLTLYRKCYKATHGHPLRAILETEQQ